MYDEHCVEPQQEVATWIKKYVRVLHFLREGKIMKIALGRVLDITRLISMTEKHNLFVCLRPVRINATLHGSLVEDSIR
jgi:hypothetical protein